MRLKTGDVTACRMLPTEDVWNDARGKDKATHKRNHWALVKSCPVAFAEVSHPTI
jgi:hypothetical protein